LASGRFSLPPPHAGGRPAAAYILVLLRIRLDALHRANPRHDPDGKRRFGDGRRRAPFCSPSILSDWPAILAAAAFTDTLLARLPVLRRAGRSLQIGAGSRHGGNGRRR